MVTMAFPLTFGTMIIISIVEAIDIESRELLIGLTNGSQTLSLFSKNAFEVSFCI